MKNIFVLFITFAFCNILQAQLTVDTSNGNVGIKDSSPEEALTISGNTSSNNFGSNYFIFNDLYSGTLSSSIDKNGLRWQVPNQSIYGDDSIRLYQVYNYGQDKLFFDNDADYTNGVHMTIERDGNVGIGTNAPLNTLQVNGDALFNSSVGNLKFGFPTGNGWGYATTGGGATLYMYSYTNTSTEAGTVNRVTFKNDGTNGFGTASPQKALHAEAASSGGALRLTRSGSACIFDAGSEISEAFVGTTSNHNFRFLTNNSVRMQILANGDVGIGTTSPTYKLQIQGDMGISGQIFGVSDRRLKEDIHPITNGLEIIQKINPVEYNFRTSEFPSMQLPNGKQYGLIAQDLESFLPEIINNDGKAVDKNGKKMNIKSVNYIELIPILTKAIQEQQEIIDALLERVEKLEGKR